MDEHYDALFDLRDRDEHFYHQIIPSVDVSVFRHVLDLDINVINNSKLNPQKWAKFKYELLLYEKKWGVNIFK